MIVGIIAGFLIRKMYLKIKEQQSFINILKREKESQKLIQSSRADAKIEISKMKKDLYLEIEYRKEQNLEYEKLLNKRERKLNEREEIIETQTQNLYHQREIVKNVKLEYHQKIDQIIMELEKISGMSRNEAKDELFSKLKKNYH